VRTVNLDETIDSRMLLGSSPERDHFWHRNSLFCRVLARRLRNVRLAALNLKEDSGVDLGGLRPEPVISENLRFHLNSRVSHFSPLMSPCCAIPSNS